MADDLLAFGLFEDEEGGESTGQVAGAGGTAQQHPAKTDDHEAASLAQGTKVSRQDKLNQTEETFQQLRAIYRPKIENGEIWKGVKTTLPLGSRAVPKMEAHEILHAVEELFFFQRYGQGAELAGDILTGDPPGLDADTKATLALYRDGCLRKTGPATTADDAAARAAAVLAAEG